MNDSKKKNIIAVIVFSAIQVMFLYSHFSIAGTVNTAFIIIYLVVRNIIKAKEENRNISFNIGNYIGVSILNIFLILVLKLINKSFIDSFQDFAEGDTFGVALGVAIGTPFLLIGFVIASAIINKKGPISRILKYAIVLGLDILFLSLIYEYDKVGNIIYFAPAVFIVIVYIFDIFANRIMNASDKSLLISTLFSSAVFIIIACINPKYGQKLLYGFTHLVELNTIKWYYIVILVILFVVAAALCFVIDSDGIRNSNEENKDIIIQSAFEDTYNLLLVGFDLLCLFIGIKYYIKYTPIFAVLLLLINVLILLVPINNKTENDFFDKLLNNRLATELFMFIVLVLLYIGFWHGIIDVVIISLLIVILYLALFDSKWVNNIAIIMVGILACDMAYHWHNSKAIFAYIIAVTILLSGIIFVLGIHNKHIENGEKYIPWQALVFIIGTIVILSSMVHSGVKISADVDNNISSVDSTVSETTAETSNIIVSLKPRGKDNNLSYCSYYWTSDKKNVVTPETTNGELVIEKNGSDTLVIICADKNGVVTTYRHSFNIK